MIAVLVLLGLVVLRLLVLGGLAYLLIPPGRRCPACGEATVPIQQTGLARCLPRLERRWCMACGWSWFRRRSAVGPPASATRRPAENDARI